MSLWRLERVRVVLRPDETLLLRTGAARGSALRSQSLAPLDEPEGPERFAEALASPEWRARALDIVISNALVRFVVTDPHGASLSQLEERALASARLIAIHGGTPQDWRLAVQSQPSDEGVFAAAIATPLFDAVQAAAARAGIPRFRLRPMLTAAEGRAARRLSSGWWVLVEPGWWCLLEANKGAWRQIVGEPCPEDWPNHLALRLERATRAAGRAASPLPIRVQAIGTPLPDRVAYPPGWAGERVLPKKDGDAWDWERF